MKLFALIPGMQGLPEILLIIFVILLLFGSKKLPELARSLGKSINEFKKGQTESSTGTSSDETVDSDKKDEETPPSQDQ